MVSNSCQPSAIRVEIVKLLRSTVIDGSMLTLGFVGDERTKLGFRSRGREHTAAIDIATATATNVARRRRVRRVEDDDLRFLLIGAWSGALPNKGLSTFPMAKLSSSVKLLEQLASCKSGCREWLLGALS